MGAGDGSWRWGGSRALGLIVKELRALGRESRVGEGARRPGRGPDGGSFEGVNLGGMERHG